MRSGQTIASLVIGIAIGACAGWFVASQRARIAVLSGPYSDNYGPALAAIADARAKARGGDTNVMVELQRAEDEVKAAQKWSRRFLHQPDKDSLPSKP